MNKGLLFILGVSTSSLVTFSCGNSSTEEKAEVESIEVIEVDKAPKLSAEDKTAFEGSALKIAKTTFKTLAKNVKMAMAEGGVQHAVEFCNVKAMPLTDSVSLAQKVQIKRLTDKTRNSKNSLGEADKEIWSEFMNQKETADTILPVTLLSENGNDVITYVPILLNKPLCLNCHGVVGTNISETDYELIHNLYPEDKATGYALGDLRGMWKITQTKN